jgi:hypothetical protein
VARSREKQRPVAVRRVAAPKAAGVALAGAPAESVLPEVVAEGNTHADWSAWEDSMTVWDSQMADLMPSQRVYVRESRHGRVDEIDPFAAVGKKRDL